MKPGDLLQPGYSSNYMDSAWTFALCQLRSPSSRVQGLAKVDPGGRRGIGWGGFFDKQITQIAQFKVLK